MVFKDQNMQRSETVDSGFKGSDNSDCSRPESIEENLNMKDLYMQTDVSDLDMMHNDTVNGGMKDIELKDLSSLNGFDKARHRDINGLQNGADVYPDKPLLEHNLSSASSLSSTNHVAMKKGVGLVSGVALIVGTMIGSGIFISPKGVLMSSGSVGMSIIIWSLCGVLALLGALSYAELGTMITKSGAEYVYLKEAFGPLHKTIGPVPSFLYAWTSVLILKPALFGVVAMSFALYTVEPFYGPCGPNDTAVKLVSVLCLFIVTFINAWSVSLATKVQNFFTIMKLIAVAIIVIGGAYMISQGNTENLKVENSFEDTSYSLSMIALAFYDGLWAYDGWNNLNYVTEEIKNPFKNLPRSIMIGIPLVTLCYILINISYFTVMTKFELLNSTAVATTWGYHVLGAAAVIIPISVAFSTFGAANGSCFTGARVLYIASREGHLPEVFSYVHVRQLTPLPSLLVSTTVASAMVLNGEIFQLIDFFSFAAWFFYGLTMLSLIVMRYTQPNRRRPYKVPIVIPTIVLICSIYLVVAPILQNPRIEFFYAFLFIISGVFFYVPFVVYKKSAPGMSKLTYILQMVLTIAPSKYIPAE